MPTLVVKYKDGSRTCPLREGVPVFIGRAKECDVHLPSPAVSRRHAVVIFKNNICGIKDMGSFNGTLVNGKVIAGAQHLTDADVVQISSFIIRLDASDVSAPQPKVGPKKGTTVILPEDRVQAALNADADEIEEKDATTAHDLLPEDDSDKTDFMPGRPLHGDSRTFPHSRILLPRAMEPDGDVDRMLDDLPAAPPAAKQGRDTLPDARGPRPGAEGGRPFFPPHAGGGAPDATVEVNFPADYARSLAREAQKDVDAIMPKRCDAPKPAPAAQPGQLDFGEDDGYADDEGEVIDAEKIIPMNDPDPAPRLTLEWDDDETNRALAALVADVEPDVSAQRGRAGAPGPEFDDAVAGPDETRAAESAGPSPDDTFYDTTIMPVPEAVLSAGEAVAAAGKPGAGGLESVVIPQSLQAAINARLALYPMLDDLAAERKRFRGEHPDLAAPLLLELDRQDAEQQSLPNADETERLLADLAERRARRDAELAFARENKLPPEPVDGNIALVEQLAESQWTLLRESARETLPVVYREAYKLAADEPLARDFAAARINHGRLLGGAMYLLALESMTDDAREARNSIAEQLRNIAGKGLTRESGGGFLGKLGALGGAVNRMMNKNEIRAETQRLEELDRETEVTAGRVARELACMESTLIREFRQVFVQTAAQFALRDDMPLAVRAFLRFGAVGFKAWWMRPEVRDFIRSDCAENIVASLEAGPGTTTVLYADEYLAALANMECPPLPLESGPGADRSSVEWKTELAYRRIVNAPSYNVLMDDMLNSLDGKLREYDEKSAALTERIEELRAHPFPGSENELFGLQTEEQVIAIRRANMEKHIKRIETDVVASILEAIEDSEGRFRRGEFRMPDSDFLVAREAETLANMMERMAGAGQMRFIPLTIRARTTTRRFNDRAAVAARLRAIEQADPGVFFNTIIPAKKKENRVELRQSPVVVIAPGAGTHGLCAMPGDGMEGGNLVVPMSFVKDDMAENAFAGLLANFRWETARLLGGQDVEHSETLAGAFIRFRKEWQSEPKAKREKAYIFTELSDKRNWRRVYAAFLSDALNSTRRLQARNPALYENVITPYLG